MLLTGTFQRIPVPEPSGRTPAFAGALLAVLTLGCAPAQAQTAATPTPRATQPSASVTPAISPDLMTPQEAEPATLEVSGTGEVTVPADRARISFAVETEGKTAGDAAGANADAMDAALSALRGAGVDGLQIETHGYGLHPQYGNRTEPNQAPRIVGYRAVNTISATTTDIESVGTLIDAATAAGVNRVAGLSFDASDTQAARQQALARAVERARGEAEAIASALGVPLGRVLRVQGGAQVPIYRPQAMAVRGMAMEAAPTPIEAGEQTVQASVTITFALGSS